MDPLLLPTRRSGASDTRPSVAPPSSLEASLRETAERLFGDDADRIRLDGKLLRPRVALRSNPPEEGLRAAALAIQLAHEASLLHDDVVDGAATRRDRPTTPARDGTAAALIAGDRLLTLAYRAASATGSPAFVHYFALAVDRTVAGEARQGAHRGRTLGLGEYRSIIEDKSGALFGIAMAAHPILRETGNLGRGAGGLGRGAGDLEATTEIEDAWNVGVRIGALYQMVDDVLDYCPAVDRGKPSMTDFRQGKWTVPLFAIGDPAPFSMTEADLMERLVSGGRSGNGGPAPLREALRILEEEAGGILSDLGVRGSVHESGETRTDSRDPIGPTSLAHEVLGWVQSARDGVRAQENFSSPASRVEVRARDLGGEEAWPDLFRRHSRSFHFAARLFPPEVRRRITGVYVFCRFTDDLVDEADVRPDRHGGSGRPQAMHRGRTDRHPTDLAGPDRSSIRNRLDAWRRLVRRAHGGAETGVPLLDQVVGPAGYRGIPLAYLDELLSGVEMDIDPGEYHDLEALRVYTYRVASVVGGWITEELGVRNPGILDRAFALGHAMQMTNILRDVGEDLRAGRLYLPLDRMAAYGILRSDLEAAARGRAPMPSGFPDLLEELMEYADREYHFARTGLHALPFQARAAVAVAARVYQGIHDEIRKRSYDSLTGRAYTTRVTKLRLGAQALLSLLLRVRHGGLP